ncbi:hypothetical protein [Nocardia iowensis]|uniref:Uncharacterized protein n=1 Tax=Nocardia iowensis TaxID=204891 RepID=A0ABX8RN08_NOCIO|nr:hypothetical protein [Nocardia iowensis]QXN90274.1 hypothetical protein KV110_33420 [Nocardia iowensis]
MSDDPTPPAEPAEPPIEPDKPPAAIPTPTPPAPEEAEGQDPIQLGAVIAELRRDLESARTDASTALDQAAQQARDTMVQEIGRALGLVADENTDPEQVIAELTDRASTSDRRLRDYRIKDAIAAAADTHRGDNKLLVPYLRGLGALDELDPDATDFTTRVDALVADAIATNPKLANTPPVERSGGEFSAGNSTPPAPAVEDDIEAIRRKVRDSIADSRT